MNALIFGASGSIGKYIFEMLEKDGINVIGTTRNANPNPIPNPNPKSNIIHFDDKTNSTLTNLSKIDAVDIIIWSQGFNVNDNIENFDSNNYELIMDAHVGFILKTLHFLLQENKIKNGAKLVIISSIWEETTRENKLSYSISKSALSGLVKNVAFDLSSKNILINNVLPGVVDNEMTRKTLSQENLNYIQTYMGFNRLINYDDIYKTIKFLVVENTGITGQSIKVDLGFTNIRKYGGGLSLEPLNR